VKGECYFETHTRGPDRGHFARGNEIFSDITPGEISEMEKKILKGEVCLQ